MSVNIEALRDVFSVLNRPNQSEMDVKGVSHIFSPPFRGFIQRDVQYSYPPQLSGLNSSGKEQKINVSGDTKGNSQFGGINGASYGIATGGSYWT